ncbi:MAG: DUF4837 family protein [Paludibacteraceae bacterium]|nr:DUF4837 family protein [Paludibacteraceae bacterium]
MHLRHTTLSLLLPMTLLLTGCGNGNQRSLVSATGTIYECLVVIPGNALSSESLDKLSALQQRTSTGGAYDEPIQTYYDMVRSVMAEPMPCMPQIEPYFQCTHVTPQAFDNLLKPTRNILQVDVNPQKYTHTQTRYFNDVWSHPQAVCRIQTPAIDSLTDYWLQNGEQIREWFIRSEMSRQAYFYRASTDKEARKAVRAATGADMLIPEEYMLIQDTILRTPDPCHVVWCCNNKGSMRRDLIVYAYPYTSDSTFTRTFLCDKRDEVLGRLVTATVPGSHMGTEYRVFPPQMRPLTVQQDGYAAEIRGLWKMLDGEAMGGPFVSHTRLNYQTAQVVTAEVFVFASGQKKRNALRQAEAILYTMQLPQDKIGD